uniref:Tubulin polyglutamylase TTLL6 n=1 Tax=Lygus hesperus TaxID=30085 RepID=A0A0A9XVV4_LYGHE
MNEKSHSSTNKSKSEAAAKRRRWSEKLSLINTANCRFDIIRHTASELKIQESTDDWDILWTDGSTSVEKCRTMKRYQRTNHFPGMMEICQKHFLARNLNRLLKAFPQDYKIFPRTWCLRSDIYKVVEYAKTHRDDCFIVKPDFGCQGRGITITRNINQLRDFDEMICQIYIQKPFLIDGYKFDLRIYVLITSCDPLRVFVYNEGLARFATAKYEKPTVAITTTCSCTSRIIQSTNTAQLTF